MANYIEKRPAWHIKSCAIDRAWHRGFLGDRGQAIAVFDTGIDVREGVARPHLGRKVVYMAGRPRGDTIYDRNGHGTKLAALACGRHCRPKKGSQRLLGFAGVAPRTRLVNFRIADKYGCVDPGVLEKGLKELIGNGRKDQGLDRVPVLLAALDDHVWGSLPKGWRGTLKRLLGELNDKGILVVVPSGDSGRDLAKVPAHPGVLAHQNLPNVVTVAPVGRHWDLRRNANTSKKYVDLTAPGVDLPSVAPLGAAVVNGGSGAAALVAGVAALLFGRQPDATPEKIRDRLLGNDCSRQIDSLKDRVRDGRTLDLSGLR